MGPNDVPLGHNTPPQMAAGAGETATAEHEQALAPGVVETDPSLWDPLVDNAGAHEQFANAADPFDDQAAQHGATQLPLPAMHNPLDLAAGAGIGRRAIRDQIAYCQLSLKSQELQ